MPNPANPGLAAADNNDADDSVVMVDDDDDDDDMDDGETVMVDALEALRIHQPHNMQPDRLSQLAQAAEAAADRPQTASRGTRSVTNTLLLFVLPMMRCCTVWSYSVLLYDHCEVLL